MKLVIKRSEWLRGEGVGRSKLLRNEDGKMCCLGFLACALSASPEEIRDKETPACTPSIKWPDGFIRPDIGRGFYNDGCSLLMEINDMQFFLSEAERENELTRLFKRFGIDVEFVD